MNWKIVVTVVLFLYCLFYIGTLDAWHFIDYVNLVFHEAGHVVFGFFGYFITIAGGTIMQLLVPLVCAVYFYFRDDDFSASLILYWLGIDLFNISVYAGDALRMQLPLITNDKDTHDWNQMLFTIGQLRHTDLISHIIFGLGIVVIILALGWGIFASRQQNFSEN